MGDRMIEDIETEAWENRTGEQDGLFNTDERFYTVWRERIVANAQRRERIISKAQKETGEHVEMPAEAGEVVAPAWVEMLP